MIDSIETGNFFRVFPAIDVLGRSGDPRVIEPLTKLLNNPSYLPEAARALGKTGARAAIKPLLHVLKSAIDSIVRVAAVSLTDLREKFAEKSGGEVQDIDELIKMNSTPESVRRLLRVLSNSDIAESIAICKVLGAMGSAEAVPALTLVLDSAPPVAQFAAEALKRISKDVDEPLLAAIRDGGSQRRKAILPVLVRFNAAIDVALCLNDEDSEVRALACEALARIGNASVVEHVFPLLADKNMRVVHAATATIQALGNRNARELAIKATKSTNKIVRRSALRILSYFGDDLALDPILTGLQDEDPGVRETAIQGLPYLENPKALEALLEMAKSSVAKNRARAMRSLALAPKVSERAISLLLKCLSDSDAWVRYYACQSLGRIEYNSAASEIVKLLQDEAGQVRVSAVEALSHLKSPAAHEALREAALSDEADIKRAALVGLGFANRSEDLSILLAGAKSNDISTKLMALSALSGFTSPLVVEALKHAASDLDEQVSSTAINFLSARPEQLATNILVQLLKVDASRERAQSALRLEAKGRLTGLLESLEIANDDLASLLVAVISKMERSQARIGLLSAFKLNNPAARKAAATGLAARREPEMISALQEAASVDKDSEVRQICTLLLRD